MNLDRLSQNSKNVTPVANFKGRGETGKYARKLRFKNPNPKSKLGGKITLIHDKSIDLLTKSSYSKSS